MKGKRHALQLVLVVTSFFAASCRDRDPVGPGSAEPDLVPLFYAHNTSPPGCYSVNTCILDDLATEWVGVAASTTTHDIEIYDAVTPTARGETFSAKFRMIAKSNGHVTDVGTPPCWFRSNAYRPDGRVIIQGRNIDCSVAYFTFTSYAPPPVPTLVEFERPDQVSCIPNRWCNLTVRLKIDIPGSGWYVTDETMIYVESASGSRWNMPEGAMSVAGSTISWTYNRLFYPGPGSRIAVKYHPWGRNDSNDTVTIHLPFDAPSGQLSLTADPAQIDSAGQLVTFTASAPGAAVQVLDWTWLPEDSSGTPVTSVCAAGVNPCVTDVYEAGTMFVSARVDGQSREAYATVSLPPACPVTEPYLTDPDVIDGLRWMWDASFPSAPLADKRERTGNIIVEDGRYDVRWVPTIDADMCSVGEAPRASQTPPNAVAWVHTHPGSETSVPPGICRDWPERYGRKWTRGATFDKGPSKEDREYLSRVRSAIGRDIPGIILESDGLTLFTPEGEHVTYPRCVAWKSQ